MITDIATLRRSLKPRGKVKPEWSGVILYEGPSLLDGAPIVVIANRIAKASTNGKTGAMVQTFILRSDMNPLAALDSGADQSICGDCKHRPIIQADKKRKKGSCYVNVGQSPMSVFDAFQRGRYARPGVDFDKALIPALFAGLVFRLGSYGDPTAAPFMVWRRATLNVSGMAGYTHQWRNPQFHMFKDLCMASADSAEEMQLAHSMGWRTFRVRNASEPIFIGLEKPCPASAEMGHKTSCDKCKACGGLSAKAKVSMVIIAHGATANQFRLAA